jgi:peptidoglycan hydrolase-like protein with peptidoglycan-binding domain
MLRLGTMAAGLLLATAAALPGAAVAQTTPGLTYAQPLSPAAMMMIQDRLRQAGAYTGRADGVWGPESQAALERYQQRNGLQVTGGLNQATAATLGLNPGELLAAGTGPALGAGADAASGSALSRGAVRNLQSRLRTLGFYRGAVDGIWGAGTQAAIERFQHGRGLQPTGQLTPATAQAMGLDPNNLEAPYR